jgi:hypothetical protein
MLWLQKIWALRSYLSYAVGAVKLMFSWIRSFKTTPVKETFMVGQYDIANTKEVLALGLTLTADVIAAYADDKKVNLADWPKFTNLGVLVVPAIKDIRMVPKELGDIQESELIELKEFVIAQGKDIPGINEKWLKVASASLKMGLGLLEMIEAFQKPTEEIPA